MDDEKYGGRHDRGFSEISEQSEVGLQTSEQQQQHHPEQAHYLEKLELRRLPLRGSYRAERGNEWKVLRRIYGGCYA